MNERAPRYQLPLASLAALVAGDFEGISETEGANRGPAVEWFQKLGNINPGSPWCAAYVNGCAEVAAAIKNVRSPLERVPHQGYVEAYHRLGLAEGWVVPASEVGVGDLFLLYDDDRPDPVYGGRGRHVHIGFVRRPPHDGWEYETLEGNTNEDGSPEGIGVFRRTRPVDDDVTFLRWAP